MKKSLLLLLSAVPMFAQWQAGEFRGWVVPTTRVVGHPFSATATIRRTERLGNVDQKESTESWKVCRDEQGRIRQESADGKTIAIFDPATGVLSTIFPARKQVLRYGPETRTGAGEWSRMEPWPRSGPTTDLGTRVIDGLTTHGTRVSTANPVQAPNYPAELVAERWESDDLQVVVSSSITSTAGAVTTLELTNIVRGAPDRRLFDPPTGFLVLDVPFSSRDSWIVRSGIGQGGKRE